MKILFVSLYYHPVVGGSESQTRMIAHELSNRHHVEVVATNFKAFRFPSKLQALEEGLFPPPFNSYMDEGMPVHALQPTALEKLRMLPLLIRVIPKLRNRYFLHFRRFGYRFYRSVYVPKLRALMKGMEVVHCVTGDYLAWAAEEAARAEGIPFLITPYVHPGFYGEDIDNVKLFRCADMSFALLETHRQHLVDLGLEFERIRLSGVVPLLPAKSDPESFRYRHGLSDAPVVLFVGRMSSLKGVASIINAAPHVWQTMPDVQFLFIGPPSQDDDVSRALSQEDRRIRYLGSVSEQEKGDALAACDLLIMPSLAEILPAVYLEAWSYGKPVIGGKAAGLPELIEGNGAGVTVEQVPEQIASRLVELLGNEPLRREMGQRGLALVEKRFSKQALARALESAYEECLINELEVSVSSS